MGNEQSEFDREGNSHGEQKERRDNNSKSEDHSSGQKERRVEATPNASEPSQISCKSTSKKVRDQAATPDPTLVDSTNQHLMQREAKQGPLDAAGNDALQEFSRCVRVVSNGLLIFYIFFLSGSQLVFWLVKWQKPTRCRSYKGTVHNLA